MPTPAPFAIESNGPETSADGVRSRGLAVLCRRPGQYRTLLLLTLGIAVVLWGSWWRFSEYSPHQDLPYKMLAAKLWAGPLPDIGLRSAHLPARSHLKYDQLSVHQPIFARRGFVRVVRVTARQGALKVNRSIPTVTSRPPPFAVSLHS